MRPIKYAALFFVFLLVYTQAIAQKFDWAYNPKGLDYDMANDIIADPDGNIYLTGYFRSSDLDFAGSTIHNTGGVDSFGTPCFDLLVGKMDSNAILIWGRSFGQQNYMESGQGIACDQDGNTFVTGWFTSTAFVLDGYTLTNAGGWDSYVAKFDTAGVVQWAYRIGGSSDDVGTAVSVDPDGNVLVTGYFYSPSITIGTTTLTPSGSCDVYLAKYDNNGNVLWAKKAGGSGLDLGKGVDTDPSGNIYLTGQYSSSNMNFGSHTINTSGSSDVFLAKYNPQGVDLWAKKGGGSKMDHSYGVSVYGYYGCAITGAYASATITFGTTPLTNAQVNTFDIFTVCYDSAGTVIWAKKAGGPQDDIGRGISFDPYGNLYVTGDFISPTLSFGGTTINNSDATGIFSDAFVICFDNGGTEKWFKKVDGLYNENCYAVTTDDHVHAYLTGSFESLNISFSGPNCMNSGSTDLFYARMGPDTSQSAIYSEDPSLGILVYPNPARDVIHVKWNVTSAKVSCRLVDQFGRVVADVVGNSGDENMIIDLSLFSPGLYLLETRIGEQLQIDKVLVE